MRIRRGSRRRRSGAAAVELAVMLPLFFMLIFAHVEFSRMGMVQQLLPVAAREAARVASLNGTTQSDINAAIARVLDGAGIIVETMAVTPAAWTSAPYATPITVSLSVPYRRVSWLPAPSYLGDTVLSASATLNSERP